MFGVHTQCHMQLQRVHPLFSQADSVSSGQDGLSCTGLDLPCELAQAGQLPPGKLPYSLLTHQVSWGNELENMLNSPKLGSPEGRSRDSLDQGRPR